MPATLGERWSIAFQNARLGDHEQGVDDEGHENAIPSARWSSQLRSQLFGSGARSADRTVRIWTLWLLPSGSWTRPISPAFRPIRA